MSSVSHAVLMAGNFFALVLESFEFDLAMTFTKYLRFYVERKKEYLLEINDRNVVDGVFFRLIGLPRFLDTLDVKSGCRVIIPKASVAA
jgi:hypothetical protein